MIFRAKPRVSLACIIPGTGPGTGTAWKPINWTVTKQKKVQPGLSLYLGRSPAPRNHARPVRGQSHMIQDSQGRSPQQQPAYLTCIACVQFHSSTVSTTSTLVHPSAASPGPVRTQRSRRQPDSNCQLSTNTSLTTYVQPGKGTCTEKTRPGLLQLNVQSGHTCTNLTGSQGTLLHQTRAHTAGFIPFRQSLPSVQLGRYSVRRFSSAVQFTRPVPAASELCLSVPLPLLPLSHFPCL